MCAKNICNIFLDEIYLMHSSERSRKSFGEFGLAMGWLRLVGSLK